jgi:hypothetical protein
MTTLTSADGKSFKSSLADWLDRTDGKLDALVRQCAQQLSQQVVEDTPVDTGFLRGSWQPSIGEPASGADASTNAYPASEISLVVAELRAGDKFFLINNCPYARRLEYGFVGPDKLGRVYNQKGRYYVTRNVKQWRRIVAKVAAELGL